MGYDLHTMKANEKSLWRKWSRLIDANRFDDAQAVQMEIDAIFDRANPGANARREAWQAAQVESEARANCGGEGDESTAAHDPREQK